jgi:hypothetical protein
MSADRDRFREELTACLAKDAGVVALMTCIASHFPDFEVYREDADLVIKDGRRFLMVRRTGADSFLTETYVDAPSTNEIDEGGGHPRDVDDLFDELVDFSEV